LKVTAPHKLLEFCGLGIPNNIENTIHGEIKDHRIEAVLFMTLWDRFVVGDSLFINDLTREIRDSWK
jgi:hypothetical protein